MIDRIGGRESVNNGFLGRAADRMKPATGRIMDHVVITGWAYSGRNQIQAQSLAYLPRHNMISARGVAADAESTDQFVFFIIQSEPAAKHIHASDLSTNHWIVGL